MKLPLVFASVFLFGRNTQDRQDVESGTNRLVEDAAGMPREEGSSQEGSSRPQNADFNNLDEEEEEEAEVGEEHGQLSTSPPVDATDLRSPRHSPYAYFRKKLSCIKDFILQTGEDENAGTPNYRVLPILSGIIIPFSILLQIPGLTGHWYIVTEGNMAVPVLKNGALLDVGLSISLVCALIANIAMIFRFLEKKVRTSTLVAIGTLTIHDIINVVTVAIFSASHRLKDGFSYGPAFWSTVFSTIAALITNIMLIIDYIRTPDFARSSSGLTRRQRSLVIVVMILLVWIGIGALVYSFLMDLTFINGMYFTVVAIETIGFGDIVPKTAAARVFCVLHSTTGILNVALVITVCRATVAESFEASYHKRLAAINEKRKAHRLRRLQKRTQKEVIKRQLERAGLPVFVQASRHVRGVRAGKWRMILNVDALTAEQKAAAMQEAEAIVNEGGESNERESTFNSQSSFDHSIFAKGVEKEFMFKLGVVWTFFLTFWLIGSVIFMATEGWSYGIAMWFCFESFSTIGFGDYTPVSPAGRSVFIVWALVGVATMTILISVISEAYSSRYQKAIEGHASRSYTQDDEKEAVSAVEVQHEMAAPRVHVEPRNLHGKNASCPDLRARREDMIH